MTEDHPTIFIVDDDASVCRGLERLLKSAGLRTRTFRSASEFLQSDTAQTHGCVLLDVRMPDIDGLAVQRILKNRNSATPVIFLTGHGDIPMSVEAMKRGAVDFLTKPFEDEALLQAIDRALTLGREEREHRAEIASIEERIAHLTPREREVFELVVTGMLNKQIGHRLGTSEKTIKVHRSRVMRKLAANSLADLVRMAERVGVGSQTD